MYVADRLDGFASPLPRGDVLVAAGLLAGVRGQTAVPANVLERTFSEAVAVAFFRRPPTDTGNGGEKMSSIAASFDVNGTGDLVAEGFERADADVFLLSKDRVLAQLFSVSSVN